MIKNLPNSLTLMRVVLIPAIYLSLISHSTLGDWSYWLALIFYTLAVITDFFDGWIARKFKVQSKFGSMLDPIADKLIVTTVLIMLVDNRTLQDVHTVAALVILFREILVSGLREYLTSLQVGLPVSQLAKVKTLTQMLSLGFLLAAPSKLGTLLYSAEIGLVLLWFTAILTMYTGYDYIRVGIKHTPWHR